MDFRKFDLTEQGLKWSLISESLYGQLVCTRKAFAIYLRGYLQYLFSFFVRVCVCVASINLSVISSDFISQLMKRMNNYR